MNNLPLPEWFLRWLSVDTEKLEGGTASLRFARFPEGELGLLALLVLVAAFAVVAFTYYREGNVPTWRKAFMATVRCLLLLVLAGILLYPVLEVDRARDLRAVSLVLLDDSLSFGIRDRYRTLPEYPSKLAGTLSGPDLQLDAEAVAKMSRAELVTRALGHPEQRILERLRAENLVEVYTFSDKLSRVSSADGAADEGGPATRGADEDSGASSPSPPGATADATEGAAAAEKIPLVRLDPRGPVTDLDSNLRAAIEQQGGTRVAGVVVFSDGRLTRGEGPSRVAQLLRQKGIPVHAVGVGDPSPARNLRVTAVLANERVFAGDPIAVDVRLQHVGYDGETVQVELVEEYTPDGETTASQRILDMATDVTFQEGTEEASTTFNVELDGIGRHHLTARVAVRPEESFADDNSRSTAVEVVEEASKALLIAGGPSYEYRYLQNLLRRDRRIHVAAWLMSADPDFPQEGNESLRKLPDNEKDLFDFDVVILIDVDPDGLPVGFPSLLERFVGGSGGGLLFVAGEKFTVKLFRPSPALKPIHDMIPIFPDLARADGETGRGRFHERAWPLVPTRVASSHPPTRLSSDPVRNRRRWEEIEGIHWSFPVRKAKPAAIVLLSHSDPARSLGKSPQPVLLWQYYEGGRVVFLGSDETWRWRSTTEDVYDQFWVQTVRFLTESRLTGGKRQLLQTDSETYELGDFVRISAMLQDESYKPLTTDSQTVRIEQRESAPLDIKLDRDESAPGWYRGVFVPRVVGEYRLRLVTETPGKDLVVNVNAPDIEFREPQLDEGTLRSLARLTKGSYSNLWEAGDVPDRISDRRETIITTDEPIPLWDKWVSLAVLAFLLTLEWILRKWNRLL